MYMLLKMLSIKNINSINKCIFIYKQNYISTLMFVNIKILNHIYIIISKNNIQIFVHYNLTTFREIDCVYIFVLSKFSFISICSFIISFLIL